MNDWWGLAWLVVLLLLNAFFVAAEFSVISARRSQIEPKAQAGSSAARVALRAMENTTLMLATSQLGITVCSLLILGVSEPAIHHLLQSPLTLTGWSESVIDVISFAIALILVSFLHVVIGEMVPKNLSFSTSDRAVLILARPLVGISILFHPIIVALNAIANGTLRLFGVTPKSEANSAFTIQEVATIVATSRHEGVLRDDRDALTAAFEFTEKQVRDVEVGMEKLVSLPVGATPSDVEHAVSQHGFSRYPIVDKGELVGYLHMKDVLDLEGEEDFLKPVPAKRIRKLIRVSQDTELEDALAAMRRNGEHLAQVSSQNGITVGVLFLEDIIEELVGEVQDATRRSKP